MHLAFDPHPDAPGRVRRAIAAAVGDELPDEVLDAVLLVASELVTNAVIHAATAGTVEIDLDEQSLTIAVTDGSPEPPVIRPASSAPGGRGLVIVERLAESWASHSSSDGGGKVVRARLSLRPTERMPAG